MLNKCYLCENKDLRLIHRGTRRNPNVNVLKCSQCGLVQLDNLIDNPDEFYENSGMRKQQELDIRRIRITADSDDDRRFRMVKSMIANKFVLDFGCGAGGFLHKAKEVCEEVYGVELEGVMRRQLESEGITCFASLDDARKKSTKRYDVITFFHVIEHLQDPVSVLGGGFRPAW